MSLIASHAAPYRFMPKHQCFTPIVELTPSRMRPGSSAELFSAELAGAGPTGQAALLVLVLLTYPGPGRPMIKASPHIVQPHSLQSPSGTSGQLAGSA